MASKADEFEVRVGNRENFYCGQQKKKTEHLWIREADLSMWSSTFTYILKCTECGHATEVYKTSN